MVTTVDGSGRIRVDMSRVGTLGKIITEIQISGLLSGSYEVRNNWKVGVQDLFDEALFLK